mmetsp:Transcript_103737/g.161742  ORF Transcript_103737/g.161742 Transcript_103737/m.161742 type:complete len:223 (+) Transcript_103737:605-1273(+)
MAFCAWARQVRGVQFQLVAVSLIANVGLGALCGCRTTFMQIDFQVAGSVRNSCARCSSCMFYLEVTRWTSQGAAHALHVAAETSVPFHARITAARDNFRVFLLLPQWWTCPGITKSSRVAALVAIDVGTLFARAQEHRRVVFQAVTIRASHRSARWTVSTACEGVFFSTRTPNALFVHRRSFHHHVQRTFHSSAARRSSCSTAMGVVVIIEKTWCPSTSQIW